MIILEILYDDKVLPVFITESVVETPHRSGAETESLHLQLYNQLPCRHHNVYLENIIMHYLLHLLLSFQCPKALKYQNGRTLTQFVHPSMPDLAQDQQTKPLTSNLKIFKHCHPDSLSAQVVSAPNETFL